MHLSLSWRAARLQALAAHGVGLEDFVLVRRGGDIVGCGRDLGPAPLSPDRDRRLRPRVAAGAAPGQRGDAAQHARATPPPGSVLAQGALLGAVVVQPSDWAVLWPALQRQERSADSIGSPSPRRTRPRAPRPSASVLHAREYHTTLYDVALGTPTTHAAWDARLVRPEVGLL
ncbi:MAG: hypothetical protein IPF87_07400 [Gemmatimonadetes bacterium]|nr:hypothetical protein [Gemmatimonadota bacterium]